MSRFPHKFLRSKPAHGLTRPQVIGLNDEGASWIEHNPTSVSAWRTLVWRGKSPKEALAMLFSAPELTPQSEYRLVFAPSVMRHWLQIPPSQVASLSELREVAQARCKQLFGVTGEDKPGSAQWQISGNWQYNKPFVCTAMHRAWAEAVDRHHTDQVSSQDLIFLVLKNYETVMPRSGWLALVVAHSLYIIQLKELTPLSLRSLRIPAQADMSFILDMARQEWGREMLRIGNSAPTLHCLYLRPLGQSCFSSKDIELIPTVAVSHSLSAASQLLPLPLASNGSDLSEQLHETLLTAWCVQQFEAGDSL